MIFFHLSHAEEAVAAAKRGEWYTDPDVARARALANGEGGSEWPETAAKSIDLDTIGEAWRDAGPWATERH